MQKAVLCYGDSNTYGYNPSDGLRYPRDVRWTGRLQMLLGDGYRVIEEGCNGRTSVFEDPIEGWKCGLDYLKPCLNSHKPVDLVILMLGSNDLKDVFHASAEVAEGITESPFAMSFQWDAVERSRQFPELYRKVAETYGCRFLNAAEYATASKEDSLHFTAEAHIALAEALASEIRRMEQK